VALARYEHLPVFADAYRLALRVDELAEKFPARARPALGADLRRASQHLLGLIIAANDLPAAQREGALRDLLWQAEQFQVLLRLAKDRCLLPGLKSYEQCANLANSVCRQTQGWMRALNRAGPDAATDAHGQPPAAPGPG
jgi:hypothetical protein